MKSEEVLKNKEQKDNFENRNSFFKPPAIIDPQDEIEEDGWSKEPIEIEEPIFASYKVRATFGISCYSGPGTENTIVKRAKVGDIFTVLEMEQHGKLLWGKVADEMWIPLNFTKRVE